MTTYTGQLGSVRNSTNLIAELRNFEVDIQGDTVEDTAAGDSWKTHKHTHKSWTASLECWYDHSSSPQNGFAVGATVAFQGYPMSAAAATGNAQLVGNAIVTGRVIKSSHDGIVELSLSLLGDGALVESTI